MRKALFETLFRLCTLALACTSANARLLETLRRLATSATP
jgi:hypothetical protein